MTAELQLFLDDQEKSCIFGLPTTTRKIINAFYEATELEKEGKRKEAERIYLELLNADFENPAVKAALGMNYAVAGKNGLAQVLLKDALANLPDMLDGFKRLGITPRDPTRNDHQNFFIVKHSEILNALGSCYKHENLTARARAYFEEAQAMIPTNPDIQNNMCTLYINEGNPEKALEHADTALSIEPSHAQAHWNRSLALLEMGRYKEGWLEYDWGVRADVRAERNYSKIPIPFWDGSKGKRLIVYGEQGIGDEILFASMLPELIKDSSSVVFECHRKLHTLFANSFPSLDIYPTREDAMVTWPLKSNGSPRYTFDAKISIGSLGRFYRNALPDFPGTPYLEPTSESRLTWAERLATLPPGPKIGISWIGGHKRTRVEVRSVELEKLLPILSQKGCTFISLQYTPCEAELEQLEQKHGIKIHHWPEAVYSSNYDDTAGLVANLDLVISVATSVIHLAGAMGIPCWVLTASRAAWREYYGGDACPWYSSLTMFRQAHGSVDWEPVIAEVAEKLGELLSGVTS